MMMDLNSKDLEYIDILLDNEINSISCFSDDVKGEEKEYWIATQKDLKDLREKLNVERNLIIQELKIDEMIDNEMDYYKELEFERRQMANEYGGDEEQLNKERAFNNLK